MASEKEIAYNIVRDSLICVDEGEITEMAALRIIRNAVLDVENKDFENDLSSFKKTTSTEDRE